jgi:hypothetical protein
MYYILVQILEATMYYISEQRMYIIIGFILCFKFVILYLIT